jgi:hypothetical protein
MSQHLIAQFINCTYIFKPTKSMKFGNQKLKRYQSSNRENNNSPEDVAESIHSLKKINVQEKDTDQIEAQSIIDITV